MGLATLASHRPACLPLVAIDRGGNGKAGRVLLKVGLWVDKFDLFAFPFGADWLGEDTQVAEDEISVAGSSRPIFLQRLVGQGLDPNGPDTRQIHLGRYDPTVIPRIEADQEEGTVGLRNEGCPLEGFWLGIAENGPVRLGRRFFRRILQPFIEPAGKFFLFEELALGNKFSQGLLPLGHFLSRGLGIELLLDFLGDRLGGLLTIEEGVLQGNDSAQLVVRHTGLGLRKEFRPAGNVIVFRIVRGDCNFPGVAHYVES